MLRAEQDASALTQFETECRALAMRGRTPEQIAASLACTKAAVMMALNRGRRKLGGYETKG